MKEVKHRRVWSYGMIVGLELLLIGVILFLWARDVLSVRETLAYFLFGMGSISLFDTVARYAQLAPRRFMVPPHVSVSPAICWWRCSGRDRGLVAFDCYTGRRGHIAQCPVEPC